MLQLALYSGQSSKCSFSVCMPDLGEDRILLKQKVEACKSDKSVLSSAREVDYMFLWSQ